MAFFGFGNNSYNFRRTSSNKIALKKTQFYVWFLGSKESDGLRGREFIIPPLKELIKENFGRTPPNKVTVQMSDKGMKIVQTLPTFSRRSGKLKMESKKVTVPAHAITYSSIGPRPFHDVVACILLLWDQHTHCPMHVHAYRCDSPETASIMHSSLQILVDRPDNQRALFEVERRLAARGLLIIRNRYGNHLNQRPQDFQHEQHRHFQLQFGQQRPKKSSLGDDSPRSYDGSVNNSTSFLADSSPVLFTRRNGMGGDCHVSKKILAPKEQGDNKNLPSDTDRVSRLHQAVFHELKEKLKGSNPILLPPKDYPLRFKKTITGSSTDLRSPSKAEWPPRSHSSNGLNNYEASMEEIVSIGRRENELSKKKKNESKDNTQPKFRWFGDTLNFKKSSKTSNDTNGDASKFRNGCAKKCMKLSPQADANGRRCFEASEFGCGGNGNWVAKPRFLSVDNLHSDHLYEETTPYDQPEPRKTNLSAASSLTRIVQRLPKPPVFDPFGRKYEQRTRVKNFWNNAPLMPAQIEDHYGLWYMTPLEHYLP